MTKDIQIELEGQHKDVYLGVEPKRKDIWIDMRGGGPSGTKDYEKLFHKPQINGVELSGNQTADDLHLVSVAPTSYWDEHPTEVPVRGQIIVYSDPVTGYSKIKVGDGNAYLVDLPFIGDDISAELWDHIQNTDIHITPEERQFWNNKLNCDISGEELTINRL